MTVRSVDPDAEMRHYGPVKIGALGGPNFPLDVTGDIATTTKYNANSKPGLSGDISGLVFEGGIYIGTTTPTPTETPTQTPTPT